MGCEDEAVASHRLAACLLRQEMDSLDLSGDLLLTQTKPPPPFTPPSPPQESDLAVHCVACEGLSG